MPDELDAHTLVQFHDAALASPGWPQAGGRAPSGGPWQALHANHRYNSLRWREEDKAQPASDVGVHDIAGLSKRLIDRYQQLRGDAVEAIDEAILEQLAEVAHGDAARMSSETPGAMADRLSILSLKIFHMRAQTLRMDADAMHIDACTRKLRRLVAQRQDLAACLDQLLSEARAGLAYFKVYLQFTLYGDPALNPSLCATPAASAAP
ncbi:DUF4254 domain-containing protein [Massilia sp. H-1]|nr:DUF4254 domain-containing protein [Massilia sp. H-1]